MLVRSWILVGTRQKKLYEVFPQNKNVHYYNWDWSLSAFWNEWVSRGSYHEPHVIFQFSQPLRVHKGTRWVQFLLWFFILGECRGKKGRECLPECHISRLQVSQWVQSWHTGLDSTWFPTSWTIMYQLSDKEN